MTTRRDLLKAGGVLAATTLIPLIPGPARASEVDWSKALVDSTMQRYPDGATLGGRWVYTWALYLYGQYLVYRRTREARYLDYIQAYVDAHVSPSGTIDTPLDSLDMMYPGNLLLALYRETGEPRYRAAADSIRARLDTYPRTSDGGFWHNTSLTGQLWLDGTHMVLVFLIRYGAMFGDLDYAADEATKQLEIYGGHLLDPATGLYFHAYDETATASWADPVTRHSPYFWGRGIGWYAMAMTEVLANLPPAHPGRQALTARLRHLLQALERYQDPATGRWFQIVDQPSLAGNWTETSASSMFTYTLARAHRPTARRHRQGVLDQISLGDDGLTQLTGICEGTNASSSLAYYLSRARPANDPHGLGAFLIMNAALH
jgi:unsaturated rhamnogalacturonyl hydrolase